ncbi:unnamed protein product [Paramecium octaurelia]|uniref:Uncharacterized protein n=1 Tax=Paramecium octaurelia TaxID=43137 RepID=A0A8S1S535_PAROT|nr:unnamed protein product [Paramecium octaurelia]CAD8135316.1 unnamed protein product [Paramecium octaurelia]
MNYSDLKKIDRNYNQAKSEWHKDLQIPEFNQLQTVRINEALSEYDKIVFMSYSREKLRCCNSQGYPYSYDYIAINPGLIVQLVKSFFDIEQCGSSILRNLINLRFNKFTRQIFSEQNRSSTRRNYLYLIQQFQLIIKYQKFLQNLKQLITLKKFQF